MNRGQGAGFRGGMQRFRVVEMPKEKHIQWKVIKKIWNYLKLYPSSLLIVAISIVFFAAFNLSLPYIIQIVIDDYINVNDINLYALGIIFLAVLLVTIVNAIGGWFQRVLMAKAAAKATRDIRSVLPFFLQKLPIKYYDENPHGMIISVLTNDIETIFNALSQVVPQLISSVITIIGSIILMFITSWQLTIVTILLFPIMIIAIIFITTKAFKYFKTQQVKLGEVNGIVKEDIDGLKVVKLYNQEEKMITTFNKANDELRESSYKAQIYSGMMMPIIRLLDNILYGVVVAIGAVLKIRYGIITVGKIQSMTNYARMFMRPVSNLAQIYNILQSAIAGGYRVFKLIEEPHEYLDESKEELKEIKGEVEFKNVSFGYKPDQLVLNDISFKAEAGKTIAIVGPTGSGKTTIINLLTRYYDINIGKIYIDNKNIYNFSKKSLRSKVGIVLQTTYLFKGTVLENIKYGKNDASFNDVVEAAKLAQVHDIIERLPKKYHTKVKEGGINFSHGERQLISIARTILSNPGILVLDEATSSVDTRTESKIQKSIGFLVKNRTSFIIAHRLQTIKNADIILVIKDGEIIERGNHEQLIAKNGLYCDMYTMQFGAQK